MARKRASRGNRAQLLWIVAAIQLCELGLLQTRSAYVGLGLILLSLLLRRSE